MDQNSYFNRFSLSLATCCLFVFIQCGIGDNNPFENGVHMTAILKESIIFNCGVDYPGDTAIPYVLKWEKKAPTGPELPIFIWYENYPTHAGEGYEGRVSRVSPDSPYGLASLNLTDIRDTDQGWYKCTVVFLNRPPSSKTKNGSWYHLDVHAPPRFIMTPEEVVYINPGDAIILNCQAQGTPKPEIVWYKDDHPVEPSSSTGIFNEGTELRISSIRTDDIGDYTCIARNGEGQISHTARVIIAGGVTILTPPTNQTRLEGDKVEIPCGAKALPSNITVTWNKDGQPITNTDILFNLKDDGTLVISPIRADDSGVYGCHVWNGIGEPQTASAYINVEFPARVYFSPSIQYLPFRLQGVVHCFIKANPPLQYVTWTKDKRLLEPYQSKDTVVMSNGSLLLTRVNQNHQGIYTCTPYNAQGTQGASLDMEVVVKKPPTFVVEPQRVYYRQIGDNIDIPCEVSETEGTPKPKILWTRKDGKPFAHARARIIDGNLTIENLRRTDFGEYQCIAQSEVTTIVANTEIVLEGTQPDAPTEFYGNSTEFSVSLFWLPGSSGGPNYKQNYTIWYRELGESDWIYYLVPDPEIPSATITNLKPSTTYEFQVVGKNFLGGGMLSKIINVTTQGAEPTPTPQPRGSELLDCSNIIYPKHYKAITVYNRGRDPTGPPRNITVHEVSNGFMITWEAPQNNPEIVKYYTILYKIDGPWKELTKNGKIKAGDNKYLVKKMVGGRTYFFKIIAHTNKTSVSSEEVKFSVPARVKQKAITAGVVGGILFFIVAIILSICAVKICNQRKRKRQEKAYNMVACRITDARNGGQIPTVRQVPLNRSGEHGVSCLEEMLNFAINCVFNPHRTCLYTKGIAPEPSSSDYVDAATRVRPITRAPDGRFILSNSRSSSISSSIDDGGFLTHPAFRDVLVSARPAFAICGDLISYDSATSAQTSIGRIRSPADLMIPTVYTSQTPMLSSSPTSSALTPILSPNYFSDLSSVRQSTSAERSLKDVHQQYSQELPSLQVIQEENERILNSCSPKTHFPKGISKLPPRHAKYARSAPELATTETTVDSHSSSSGLGSKNTSQQTGSTTTNEWKLPTYRHPPPPPTTIIKQSPIKPPYIRTWLDYTPSPPHSIISNKPLSVDDHYEFDAIFPASPTPTELVLTPLPPVKTKTSQLRTTKPEDIEARVQAMKEEFQEYKRRQAQMKRLKELESIC